ncbi:MAG: hypothetical protein MUF62_06925 [Chitinophagaceae bacterium]|nr:hypothetical protein [Chitinophagaceae bacterium]
MKTMMLSLLLAGTSTLGFSQFQLGAHGSYLQGTGNNDSRLWGGGLHGKFYLGGHIAIGAGFRTFPKTEKVTTGTSTVTTSDNLSQAFGSFDLLLARKKSLIQPFIGADAGLSFSTRSVLVATGQSATAKVDNQSTFFYLAPKAGVNIGLSPAIGLFGTASYGLTFGSGNPVNPGPIPNPIETRPVDKFFVFDAGIYIRLVGAR